MKKFVFIYYGNTKDEDLTEEQSAILMEKWTKWYESIGDKMVDGGNPFASGAKEITAEKVVELADDMWPSKGYTIINAQDMDEAIAIAQESPMLEDDKGAVRVYEALPM